MRLLLFARGLFATGKYACQKAISNTGPALAADFWIDDVHFFQ